MAKQIEFGRKNQKTEAESIEISMLPKICKTTKNYNPKIPAQSGNRGGKVVETEVETLEKYGGYLFIFCKKAFDEQENPVQVLIVFL